MIAVILAVLVMLATGPASAAPANADNGEILVFAASSLAPPLEEIAALYEERGDGKLRFSFASSAALARQIEYGAPADLFITAHPLWLNRLLNAGRVDLAQVRIIAGNRLVIASPGQKTGETKDIRALLLTGSGRIATGDPDSVPLGLYARQSLTALGLWEAVSPQLAPAANARAALLQVERGLASLGILFASDVVGSDRAIVVADMPAESYGPINYLATPLINGEKSAETSAFLSLLASGESLEIFLRHGFSVPR